MKSQSLELNEKQSSLADDASARGTENEAEHSDGKQANAPTSSGSKLSGAGNDNINSLTPAHFANFLEHIVDQNIILEPWYGTEGDIHVAEFWENAKQIMDKKSGQNIKPFGVYFCV